MNFRAHSRFSRALFSGSLVRGGLRGKGVRAIDVGWRGEPFLGFLLVALFRPSLPTLLGPRLADLVRGEPDRGGGEADHGASLPEGGEEYPGEEERNVSHGFQDSGERCQGNLRAC